MANKKINQLVLKTTIQPTDLFPLGDATTGQLFKKTVAELQAAIGGAVISVNGLVGTVVLDTDDIQELASPTNRYFTEARARAAISLTTTGSSGASTYSNSTGVLNVPTYTLAGLGGITASFLSGGTGITYNSSTGVIAYSGTVYTDASIRALLSGANGITYNSSTGQFSYSGTVYTDSSIRALLSGTAPITYNSSTGAIGINQATTSTDGYLSSTDWNTFNGKQSALTLGNFTEATSSVLTITGGTGSVIGSGTSIQVKQASSTVSGFLSSTDWNTFNNKQNTITNPVTGTGTSGHVAYWSGSGTITGEAALFYDATNDRLGIGTTTPSEKLSIIGGDVSISTTKRIYLDAGSGFLYLTSTANNGAMQFYTGDAERMRITSAGNVGIGTSSPNHPLTVKADSSANGINIVAETSGFGQLSFSNGANSIVTSAITQVPNSSNFDMYLSTYNGSSRTTKMVILGSGNVGIGTSSPGELLELSKSTYPTVKLIETTSSAQGYFQYHSGSAYFIVNAQTNHPLVFGTNDTIRIRITAGGNILMGTNTDNGERLYVSGSIRATGSITANSDVRLKKNIERIENALQKVSEISGYTYNTIYDEDRHAGVIAQEIDKVLPEIVNKGNDGLMGVEYGNISALLIEAIKEQKVLIESLQAKVEALSK